MSQQTEQLDHMGFKTHALVLGAVFAALWTLVFFLGQLIPAMLNLSKTAIVVNWMYFLFGYIMIIIFVVSLLVLHLLWKLVYVGEGFIKKSA